MGADVRLLQTELKNLGFYTGTIDGMFGGGTESAVKSFQRSAGLTPDGIVGPKTWERILGSPHPGDPPAVVRESLAYRCLALTGAFETSLPIPDCFSAAAGDFDGQGISFGSLQWNLGQRSLQPLLQAAVDRYPELVRSIFHDHYPTLIDLLKQPLSRQLTWARSIQRPDGHVIHEPWLGLFKMLGRTREFQQIEMEQASERFRSALSLCSIYRVTSERAVALMFDIVVQNGSISATTRSRIEADVAKLPKPGDWATDEAAKLRVIANRRAEAANPTWIEDVRKRKLTIANGSGTVHGLQYDLAGDYGIRLVRYFGSSDQNVVGGNVARA